MPLLKEYFNKKHLIFVVDYNAPLFLLRVEYKGELTLSQCCQFPRSCRKYINT